MIVNPYRSPGAAYALVRSLRLKAAREKGTHTQEQWLAIVERFEGRCVCCGGYPEPAPQKDHIVPIYMGGSDGAENLQPLCPRCNAAKGPDTTNWAAYREQHGFADVDGPIDEEPF